MVAPSPRAEIVNFSLDGDDEKTEMASVSFQSTLVPLNCVFVCPAVARNSTFCAGVATSPDSLIEQDARIAAKGKIKQSLFIVLQQFLI